MEDSKCQIKGFECTLNTKDNNKKIVVFEKVVSKIVCGQTKGKKLKGQENKQGLFQ